MTNTTFLEHVLGDSGNYCMVAIRTEDDRRVQKFYPTISELADAAAHYDNDGFDVYYGLATFTDTMSRRRDNVHQLKSLFLDLDCGPSKEFPTQKDAVTSLRSFCSALSLPTPMMVNSGRGIHVYWLLDKPATLDEWLPVAEALKTACKQQNFDADPAVTSDAARILRVPETHNYKQDPPLDVKMLGIEYPEPVKLTEFAGKLGHIRVTTKIDLGPDALQEAMNDNRENVFKLILQKTMNDQGCPQIEHIMRKQAEISEPLWRAGLSIAKFCSDGDKAAVLMSNKHPGYDESFMHKKLGEIRGPYTCERFDDLNPGVCANCPVRGQIKSPIVLGQRIKESEGPVVVSVKSANSKSELKRVYEIPEYPKPYFRGANGGVYIRRKNDDGDVEEDVVYHHDLYVSRRLYDVEQGELIVFRLHMPRDGVREFTIPMYSVTSKEEFRKAMAKEGITAFGRKVDTIMTYTTRWIDELQQTSTADEAHRQYGWTDETMTEFVLGDKLIKGDSIGYNPPSKSTAGTFEAFVEKGSEERYLELLEFYNQPKFQLHQFVMCMSFGSILMPLSGQNSMAVHLFGGTGVGKTTAQLIALGAWGSPEILMNAQHDTHNSRMNRAELLCNLPLVSDEMTNLTSKQTSDYIYQMSAGRQKNRMASDGNVERVRGRPWTLLALSSGNVSLWEVVSRDKNMPEAELQRLLELKVESLVSGTAIKTVTDDLMTDAKANYGWVGPRFVQYIINNRDSVKALFQKIRTRIDEAAGLESKNRFWSAGTAAVLTACILLDKVGIVSYDSKALFQWIVNELVKRKQHMGTLGSSISETLNDYINENYNHVLQIKSTQDLRGSADNNGLDSLVIPDSRPVGQVVARYETDVKKLYLLPKPLRNWCVDQQINYNSFTESLKKDMGAKQSMVRIYKGTHMKAPATRVWELDFDHGGGDDDASAEA